mgnify:CR=1 FL=1
MQTYSTIAILKEVQGNNGFIAYNSGDYIKPTDLIKRTPNAKIKFKDAFEEYVTLKTQSDIYHLPNKIDEERIHLLESTYDFVQDAFNLLGVEEIRRLKYNVTGIKRCLIAKSDISYQNKIAQILSKEGIRETIFISLADCKEKLQNAYNAVKINKTAKATDIEKYFIVNPSSKTISDNKVKGYNIIKEKFVFK